MSFNFYQMQVLRVKCIKKASVSLELIAKIDLIKNNYWIYAFLFGNSELKLALTFGVTYMLLMMTIMVRLAVSAMSEDCIQECRCYANVSEKSMLQSTRKQCIES